MIQTLSRACDARVLTLRVALAACVIAAGCDGSTGPADQPDTRPIVYFRLDETTGWTLYRVDARGGTPTALSLPMSETPFPAVSPDGSRLAFVVESQPAGIYVTAADGSGDRLVYAAQTDHISWSYPLSPGYPGSHRSGISRPAGRGGC
jgi:hypothetical protein